MAIVAVNVGLNVYLAVAVPEILSPVTVTVLDPASAELKVAPETEPVKTTSSEFTTPLMVGVPVTVAAVELSKSLFADNPVRVRGFAVTVKLCVTGSAAETEPFPAWLARNWQVPGVKGVIVKLGVAEAETVQIDAVRDSIVTARLMFVDAVTVKLEP